MMCMNERSMLTNFTLNYVNAFSTWNQFSFLFNFSMETTEEKKLHRIKHTPLPSVASSPTHSDQICRERPSHWSVPEMHSAHSVQCVCVCVSLKIFALHLLRCANSMQAHSFHLRFTHIYNRVLVEVVPTL